LQLKGTVDEKLVILFYTQIQETVLMQHTNCTTFLNKRLSYVLEYRTRTSLGVWDQGLMTRPVSDGLSLILLVLLPTLLYPTGAVW